MLVQKKKNIKNGIEGKMLNILFKKNSLTRMKPKRKIRNTMRRVKANQNTVNLSTKCMTNIAHKIL